MTDLRRLKAQVRQNSSLRTYSYVPQGVTTNINFFAIVIIFHFLSSHSSSGHGSGKRAGQPLIQNKWTSILGDARLTRRSSHMRRPGGRQDEANQGRAS